MKTIAKFRIELETPVKGRQLFDVIERVCNNTFPRLFAVSKPVFFDDWGTYYQFLVFTDDIDNYVAMQVSVGADKGIELDIAYYSIVVSDFEFVGSSMDVVPDMVRPKVAAQVTQFRDELQRMLTSN